jgi:hypothetical protein
MTATNTMDPRFIAAVDMIRRTGASEIQIRFQDDEEPVVWFVVARYERDGEKRSEVDAAIEHPLPAILRLCERLIDGGKCVHCNRPTSFDTNFGNSFLDDLMCWYSYDPELKTFRRGCEGT